MASDSQFSSSLLIPALNGDLLEVGNELNSIRAGKFDAQAMAIALTRFENAFQQLEQILEQTKSEFTGIRILGADGGLIGYLGTVDATHKGGWFFTLGVGGTNPDVPVLFCDNLGNISISPDAKQVAVLMGNTLAGAPAGVYGLQFTNVSDAGGQTGTVVQQTDRGFYILGGDGTTYVVQIGQPAAAGPTNEGRILLNKVGATNSLALSLFGGTHIQMSDPTGGNSLWNCGSLTLSDGTATRITLDAVGKLITLANASGVTEVAVDFSAPSITVGAAGAAQSIIRDTTMRVQNAANTRFILLSSSGQLSGNDLVSWSLGSAYVVNGFIVVDASGDVHSASGFTGSQAFITSVDFVGSTTTSKTIHVTDGIVTGIA